MAILRVFVLEFFAFVRLKKQGELFACRLANVPLTYISVLASKSHRAVGVGVVCAPSCISEGRPEGIGWDFFI